MNRADHKCGPFHYGRDEFSEGWEEYCDDCGRASPKPVKKPPPDHTRKWAKRLLDEVMEDVIEEANYFEKAGMKEPKNGTWNDGKHPFDAMIEEMKRTISELKKLDKLPVRKRGER